MTSLVRSTAFCLAVFTASAVSLPAQTKVAIINTQKAVADTQEIKKAQAALEAKYRPRTQTIQSLQRDLQSIEQQLRAGNVAPDKEAQLRSEGTRKQRELQRLSEDLQGDVDRERQEVLGKAGQQMQDVVRKVAELKGFDVVMDIGNTLYFKPALDLTAEATAAYDQAHPAR